MLTVVWNNPKIYTMIDVNGVKENWTDIATSDNEEPFDLTSCEIIGGNATDGFEVVVVIEEVSFVANTNDFRII